MRREHSPRNTAVAVPLPLLLSVEGVAEHLGVSVRHVRRLVAERRIPYLKWGHLLRFDPDEVGDWLEAQRVAPMSSPNGWRQ
jgi:excisionase family DNA binding protein